MLALEFNVIVAEQLLDKFYVISSPNCELVKSEDIKQGCSIEKMCNELLDTVIALKRTKSYKVTMDGYLVSLFYYVINISVPYRKLFTRHFLENRNIYETRNNSNKVLICINIVPPEREIIDYKGNELIEVSCLERKELDNAMAWLSTLGGAFSALGDTIEKCATIAGKISLRQLHIALRLGDPYLVARCKLYLALSLIQKQNFKEAKRIVQAQYIFSMKGPIQDNRLKSMCLGIWSKLRYDRKRLKEKCIPYDTINVML